MDFYIIGLKRLRWIVVGSTRVKVTLARELLLATVDKSVTTGMMMGMFSLLSSGFLDSVDRLLMYELAMLCLGVACRDGGGGVLEARGSADFTVVTWGRATDVT